MEVLSRVSLSDERHDDLSKDSSKHALSASTSHMVVSKTSSRHTAAFKVRSSKEQLLSNSSGSQYPRDFSKSRSQISKEEDIDSKNDEQEFYRASKNSETSTKISVLDHEGKSGVISCDSLLSDIPTLDETAPIALYRDDLFDQRNLQKGNHPLWAETVSQSSIYGAFMSSDVALNDYGQTSSTCATISTYHSQSRQPFSERSNIKSMRTPEDTDNFGCAGKLIQVEKNHSPKYNLQSFSESFSLGSSVTTETHFRGGENVSQMSMETDETFTYDENNNSKETVVLQMKSILMRSTCF